MQILFLGTGAADWPNPGPKVGKGRRFSSLLLNQTILIDCGPMALDAIREFDVNVNLITDIVIGHAHGGQIKIPLIEWRPHTNLENNHLARPGVQEIFPKRYLCESVGLGNLYELRMFCKPDIILLDIK